MLPFTGSFVNQKNDSILSIMISIALTTYNGESFLEEQLDSILTQSIQDYEVVCCDDCSKDNTWQILCKYAKDDNRFRVFRNKYNIGFKKNFEKAMSLCKGDFIALCDQDDIWTKNHLQLLINNMNNKMVSIGNCDLIDSYGNSYNIKYSRSQAYKCIYTDGIKASCRILFFSNPFQGASMMIKKELLEKALPIPDEIKYHDAWVVLLACFCGGFTYTDSIVNQYRMTGRNVTVIRTLQYTRWIIFKIFIKLLLFNECPKDRQEAIETILKRVELTKEQRLFLNKSLQVTKTAGRVFICLRNALFYMRYSRYIFCF